MHNCEGQLQGYQGPRTRGRGWSDRSSYNLFGCLLLILRLPPSIAQDARLSDTEISSVCNFDMVLASDRHLSTGPRLS
jgi:hypothetical protein